MNFVKWKTSGGPTKPMKSNPMQTPTRRRSLTMQSEQYYGPKHHSMHPVRAKDGVTLIKDQPGILSSWAEHLSELLICINPTDPTFIDLIPQLPIIPDLDQSSHQSNTILCPKFVICGNSLLKVYNLVATSVNCM